MPSLSGNNIHVKVSTSADTDGIDKAERSIQSLGARGGAMAGVMAGAVAAGAAAAATGIAALGVASYKSVTAFADFEQSLNVFKSVSGATAAQMTQVTAVAKQLGKDISLPGVSAKDASYAMVELAKSGLSVQDSLGAAKGVLSLAKAGQLDVADAASIAANALNAFGLKGTDANKVADILAGGANSSSASVNDLAYALQMASASAARMNIPLGDTVTALGLFANNGIAGSDAGTSLKTMLARLVPTTEEQSKAMKALGLDFFDAKGNFIGLKDTATMLQQKLGGLSQEQRELAINTIFGSDASRAAGILAKEGAAGFDAMSAGVNRANAATELAAAQNSGLKGALENIRSIVETLSISFGEKLAPYVQRVADYLGRNLDPAARRVWDTFKLFVDIIQSAANIIGSVLGPRLSELHGQVSGAVAPVIQDLLNKFRELSPVVQLMTSPLLTLITNFSNLRNWCIELKNQVASLWATLSQSTIFIIIAQYVQQVLVPAFMSYYNAIMQNLMPALRQLWESLQRLWNALNPALTYALIAVAGIIGGLFMAVLWAAYSVLNILIQAFAMVVSAISNVINWISNLIAWFGNLVGVVWNAIGSIITIFRNLIPAAQTVLSLVASLFGGLGGMILNALGNLGSLLYNAGKSLISGLVKGINDQFASIGSSITGGIKGALKAAKIPGFSSGGYTGAGSKDEVAGVVHRGEYVVPKDQVDQATGLPKGMGGGGGITINFNGPAYMRTNDEAENTGRILARQLSAARAGSF
jgi:TP901 family phage tail tape measure protein